MRTIIICALLRLTSQLAPQSLWHTSQQIASLDAHARSHSGETALHLAAASGHLEICKMLLSRTSLQLKGPAAESLHYVTPLQLAGKMHWQLALQLSLIHI